MEPETIRFAARRRPLELATSPHAVVLAFALIAVIELLHHEMWLDELNPWDIARDARSLGELAFNMRFEPHPRLWYLCLYALTRFTHNPLAMQLLHGAIATASVALIAYRSPFRKHETWLLAFGYYLVFEYMAISRGYALGIVLALACCALASADRPRLVIIALLLALLANSSAFGLILAGALTVAMAPLANGHRRLTAAIAGVVMAAGVVISLWTLTPARESRFGRDRHTTWAAADLDRVSGLLGAAYVPLPNFTSESPWNSNLLVTGGRRIPRVGHYTAQVIGGLFFVLALVHLRRRPILLLALVAGSGAMLALIYVEYSGGYRHHGHLFILLVLMLWLAAVRAGNAASRPAPRWFAGVLLAHVAAGAYFVSLDYVRPFSASKELAAFFTRQRGPMPIIVAQPDFLSYVGPPLSGYLQRQVYYAMRTGVVRGSYLWYDDAHAQGAAPATLVQEIAEFARGLGSDVWVVVSHADLPSLGVRVVQFPSNAIEGDERTTAVYLFKRPP